MFFATKSNFPFVPAIPSLPLDVVGVVGIYIAVPWRDNLAKDNI